MTLSSFNNNYLRLILFAIMAGDVLMELLLMQFPAAAAVGAVVVVVLVFPGPVLDAVVVAVVEAALCCAIRFGLAPIMTRNS